MTCVMDFLDRDGAFQPGADFGAYGDFADLTANGFGSPPEGQKGVGKGGKGKGKGGGGGGYSGGVPMPDLGFPMLGLDGSFGGGGFFGTPPEWANTTTVMMRNLPNKYTQRMLLTEINETGFLGSFDFLYLPIDPETNVNRGYAFLNFIDPSFAWMFKVQFESRKMNRFNSSKVVNVMPATLQGFDANYAHYATARVNRGDPAARPLFLRETKQTSGGGQQSQAQNDARARRGDKQGGSGDQPQPGAYTNGDELEGSAATPFPQNESVDVPKPAQSGKGVGSSGPLVPRFCPHCGDSIEAKFQFCPGCGASQDFSRLDKAEN